MKNLILIVAVTLGFTASTFASNIGEGETPLISNEKLELSMNHTAREFILFSELDANKETVQFIFENKVSMIQIINGIGEIEMMIPIGSAEVDLGLSLFNTGIYKLGFILDGEDDMLYTNLVIK